MKEIYEAPELERRSLAPAEKLTAEDDLNKDFDALNPPEITSSDPIVP